ncbi:CRISPR-associated helicase Cas3' [Aerococcaceae bacterium NML210727]|nr:CRISPR-associated helicase Cas3' [Aerococcaceae bacterium NML210727]MCW6654021.1 CRISPR-associated helicase Cas3' [Aerococcaceae bacterium NML201296]
MISVQDLLWAKKMVREGEYRWLSLSQHLEDTQFVIDYLWEHWIGNGQRHFIECSLSDATKGKALVKFLGAIHDLGKAIPAFQKKASYDGSKDLDNALIEQLVGAGFLGLNEIELSDSHRVPHNIASQYLLKQYGVQDDIGAIIGGHHGKPVDGDEMIDNQFAYKKHYFQSTDKNSSIYTKWATVQYNIFEWALQSSGFNSVEDLPRIKQPAQVLLSGLLIMADWIASNDAYFPLLKLGEFGLTDRRQRAENGIRKWRKNAIWQPDGTEDVHTLFHDRFDFVPRLFQKTLCELIIQTEEPGIFIVEAPMGQGKTEASLIAAELLAQKTGRNGIFFGLPTQATSDGIFPRINQWLQRIESDGKALRLMHGKAHLNEQFMGLAREVDIDDVNGTVFINEWFSGRKSAILSDFVVGTVDHFLMVALKQKHLALRHLGFGKKVVIIDEVHAYDAYMSQYLEEALTWMGAYGVPVIILSATLPQEKRLELIEAYLKGKGEVWYQDTKEMKRGELYTDCYPLITYTDGTDVKQHRDLMGTHKYSVAIHRIEDEAIVEVAKKVIEHGGILGIIVNTVKKAQYLAKEFASLFGEEQIELLHSRFIDTERKKKEQDLLNMIGKGAARPKSKIIIGTQVIEQSLDIDFDVLVSEVAPMDLLIQRIGRLHRHDIERPSVWKEPQFYVVGTSPQYDFDSGTVAVYREYLLARTQYYLPNSLAIPEDISPLVQKVYDFSREDMTILDGDLQDRYQSFEQEYNNFVAEKKSRASHYKILDPVLKEKRRKKPNLIGWLNNITPENSDEYAYAQVRDANETIEIIAVKKYKDGYALFSRQNEDVSDSIMNDSVTKEIAKQTLKLPNVLCAFNTDETIQEIEHLNIEKLSCWQTTRWLKGALGIIFDENNEAVVRKYKLVYDMKYGLTAERIDNRGEV